MLTLTCAWQPGQTCSTAAGLVCSRGGLDALGLDALGLDALGLDAWGLDAWGLDAWDSGALGLVVGEVTDGEPDGLGRCVAGLVEDDCG